MSVTASDQLPSNNRIGDLRHYENTLRLIGACPHCYMKEPYHVALRHMRRSAGLTQIDVARILGVGGRSYIAMLESGDRVPHVRDTVLLSMLFGTESAALFPHLYLTTRGLFQSNARAVIEAALAEGESADSERIRYLREALTNSRLSGNVAPSDL